MTSLVEPRRLVQRTESYEKTMLSQSAADVRLVLAKCSPGDLRVWNYFVQMLTPYRDSDSDENSEKRDRALPLHVIRYAKEHLQCMLIKYDFQATYIVGDYAEYDARTGMSTPHIVLRRMTEIHGIISPRRYSY